MLSLLLLYPSPAGIWGRDLQGRPVERLSLPDTHLVVLIFTASDCTISNRYLPEIARLREEFSSRKVVFWWVYPNPGDTAAVVRQHQEQFSISGETVLDTEQRLVRLAHASATPETAVFTVTESGLREVYHGRIDNRYISIGKGRPQASEHYLEQAIWAALNGKAVALPVTRPVGCSIVPLGVK